MKKKIIALSITAVLIISAVVGGTFAYLTDKDYAENVMVLGNVDIIQNEYEHDASGALVSFTQNKPLYPYVGNVSWADTGAYRSFAMENVVDKYVTVKNTGKSDAYVRTIFAFQMGDFTIEEFDKYIGISANYANGSAFQAPGTWNWEVEVADAMVVEFEGERYCIIAAVHENAIAKDEETIPSLLQVYLTNTADNAEVAKLNAHSTDYTYDILALSQAAQTNGFTSAADALNTAFGEITPANVVAWFTAE